MSPSSGLPRPPKLNKVKRVKAIARDRVGAPKPAQVIAEKPSRKPKHKKTPLTASEE